MSSGHKWKELWRTVPKPPNEALIAGWMRTLNCDRDTALFRIAEAQNGVQLWTNDLYQVEVREMTATMPDGATQAWVHLNIRRRDGYPGRDWRHFQEIKNQLIGAECEAVELYPAESRLVDQTNKYHLWGCCEPGFRFPIGFEKRDVDFSGTETTAPGLRQRPPMQFAGQKK